MIDLVVSFLDSASNFFDSYKSLLGAGLGFLFVISKVFSTSEAPIFISKVQGLFDFSARLMLRIGELLKKVAEFLGEILKSNGYWGKK